MKNGMVSLNDFLTDKVRNVHYAAILGVKSAGHVNSALFATWGQKSLCAPLDPATMIDPVFCKNHAPMVAMTAEIFGVPPAVLLLGCALLGQALTPNKWMAMLSAALRHNQPDYFVLILETWALDMKDAGISREKMEEDIKTNRTAIQSHPKSRDAVVVVGYNKVRTYGIMTTFDNSSGKLTFGKDKVSDSVVGSPVELGGFHRIYLPSES